VLARRFPRRNARAGSKQLRPRSDGSDATASFDVLGDVTDGAKER
jgi:hypothetical protein